MSSWFTLISSLKIPIALDKTFSQNIQFLGLEIDTVAETVKIPIEKIKKACSEISDLLKLKKCTLYQLQSLLGLLQFTCKVIVPGRAFLQSLYRITAGCSKPFHKIRLTKNVKNDLLIWLQFLEHFNGVTIYKDAMFLSPDVVNIFTDASKSLGAGAILHNSWFSLQWPSEWWSLQNITFLELVPIVVALETWGPSLKTDVSNSIPITLNFHM